MTVSKEDVRLLVRDLVARHVSSGSGAGRSSQSGHSDPVGKVPMSGPVPSASPASMGPVIIEARIDAVDVDLPAAPVQASPHPSHVIIQIVDVEVNSGPCVIEPAVPCTHCGYCRSWGH
jgi:hypothetical protein